MWLRKVSASQEDYDKFCSFSYYMLHWNHITNHDLDLTVSPYAEKVCKEYNLTHERLENMHQKFYSWENFQYLLDEMFFIEDFGKIYGYIILLGVKNKRGRNRKIKVYDWPMAYDADLEQFKFVFDELTKARIIRKGDTVTAVSGNRISNIILSNLGFHEDEDIEFFYEKEI